MIRIFTLIFNLGLLVAFAVVVGVIYMSDQLPSVEMMKDVRLQTPLRVYTIDGKLIGQFGEKRRIPVKIENVPPALINAFIATEDRRFYDHAGVDFRGLIRAAHHVLTEGNRGQGGSTITMQLARNMFLSPQKTYVRKINEILLALQIEKEFSKKEIMALYLNKIYLGQRAYGVSAAAEVYYGKTLNDLTLAEMATIAGLPKAPSTMNPITSPERALDRRTHVLDAMLSENYITQAQYDAAMKAPIETYYHAPQVEVEAPYVAEMARQVLFNQLGEDAYTMGFKVYTTLHSDLQMAANNALDKGLVSYDRRHGFRGVVKQLPLSSDRNAMIKALRTIPKAGPLENALVLSLKDNTTELLLGDRHTITVPSSVLSFGTRSASQLGVRPGSVIRLYKTADNQWLMAQRPQVEGAFVAIRPEDGAILALVGGFDFYHNNFNMATQAERQPGSSFKPFIYSAALDNGFTAATLVNDAPIVMEDQNNVWRPQNYERKFYGPTRMRMGLVRSRNLVSIRVLAGTGLETAIAYIERFGFAKGTIPLGLSLALGTNIVTPLQMARGFAVFANGGFLITPYVIDHVRNDEGKVIEHANPAFACDPCTPETIMPFFSHTLVSVHAAPRVITAENAYIMSDMLRDVVRRGTAVGAKVLNRSDIGGKTGTTQDQHDGWFTGFNPDIVATSWIGFDTTRSLGEYGAQAALPTWVDFMRYALKDKPERFIPQPDDVVSVRIDPESGLLASPNQQDAEFELFTLDTVPTEHASDHPDEYDHDGSDENNMIDGDAEVVDINELNNTRVDNAGSEAVGDPQHLF
ncbi:MAG: penicillin-binding protein 1A [Gammaproteobacteria bacterium]